MPEAVTDYHIKLSFFPFALHLQTIQSALDNSNFHFIMWILPLVGYLGVIVGFSFLTLAIGMFPPQICLHSFNTIV